MPVVRFSIQYLENLAITVLSIALIIVVVGYYYLFKGKP